MKCSAHFACRLCSSSAQKCDHLPPRARSVGQYERPGCCGPGVVSRRPVASRAFPASPSHHVTRDFQRADEIIPKFSLFSTVNALWALARLDYADKRVMKLLLNHMFDKKVWAEASGWSVARIAWSLGHLKYMDRRAMQILTSTVGRKSMLERCMPVRIANLSPSQSADTRAVLEGEGGHRGSPRAGAEPSRGM